LGISGECGSDGHTAKCYSEGYQILTVQIGRILRNATVEEFNSLFDESNDDLLEIKSLC
jgi:hypothetical protein